MIRLFRLAMFAAITVVLVGCNPFSPSNYEDCVAQAAKESHANDGLQLLVNQCALNFPARRQPNGKFVYYDPQSQKNFEVKGPKPQSDEWKWIEAERAKQAAQKDAEKQAASQSYADSIAKGINTLRLVKVVAAAVTCQSSWNCRTKLVTATIHNGSESTITQIGVGWVISAKKIECAPSMQLSDRSTVNIQPGGKAVLNWETLDGPAQASYLCFQVLSALTQ